MKNELGEDARRWALAMTRRPSVTGTEGEKSFGPWLAAELERDPVFGGCAEVWTFPVAPGDGRYCVAMLLRGAGRNTVILTGHYDTVSVQDYGDLRALATEPEELAKALGQRLGLRAETPAERRAKADLESGAFLPGRGLLDMKGGLAAGLAAVADFAGRSAPAGNLLFIAVPDEENNSAGARAAAAALPALAAAHGLDFIAAINLDSIADDGDGSSGRVIALGTVGKLLPTAFVAGVPTHAGFPLNGINAAALAGAVAARVEWAPELTDAPGGGEPGTPPSLLMLRDGKAGYDVTTPGTAFACFNVLSYRRAPDEVLDRFDRLCAEAAERLLGDLAQRAGGKAGMLAGKAEVVRFEAVEAAALSAGPAHVEALRAARAELAASGPSLPEQCRELTALAWRLSGLAGPAIVTGFGSIPYLPASLGETPGAARLRELAGRLAAASPERYGVAVSSAPWFAGISDVSFWGEADEKTLGVVARNTPLWQDGVGWPAQGGIAGVPTVNAGPWGRDYHTPLERMHAPYAFEVLPRLLADLVEGLLGGA